MLLERLRKAPEKYKNEIILSSFSAAVGVALGKFFESIFSAPSIEQVQLGLLCSLLAFLAGLSFMIRKNVILTIDHLKTRVAELGGRDVPSMYSKRKLHFTKEKSRLIEFLVRDYLPESIIKHLGKRDKPLTDKKLALIVDSGTTLEAFFSRIKIFGFGREVPSKLARNIKIYTNSLSGSNAFCEESANALEEDQLRLFGGTQVEKYKAVLGEITLLGLDTVFDDYRKNDGLTIGIVTANWFLVGRSYDKLVLCSAEQAHLEYKRRIVSRADHIIVVSPLGKLLRFDDLSELNTALQLREEGNQEYDGFNIGEISSRNKENTFLLTTHRTWNRSILLQHSRELYSQSEKHRLYTICPREKYLALDHRKAYEEQLEIEMPHGYLKSHALTALQVVSK